MSKPAFTLVELLVTVAVIAILTGMSLVSYSGVQARGRDAQRKNDLSQLKIALSTYYNSQAPMKYVAAASAVKVAGQTTGGNADAVSQALVPNYIRSMPVDPKQDLANLNNGFVYTYQSSGTIAGVNDQNFTLRATLENKNDKKGWNGGSAWAQYGYAVLND